MATPITVTVNNVAVQAGDTFLPPSGATIPDGYTTMSVQADMANWAATDNVFLFANFSTDGGNSWFDSAGVGTNGGVHHDRQGNVALVGFVASIPPEQAGTGVKVRIHWIVPSTQTTHGSITLT
jgi:hypothetical protein